VVVTTRRRGPQPLNLLPKAAAVENIVTWLIGSNVCGDERAFGWFMRYMADRIPVDEKIRLLGEIVESLDDDTVGYAELLDDLRQINRVRREVAHSVYIGSGTDDLGEGYVSFRRGKPTRLADDEVRAQVADALKRLKKAGPALRDIATGSGMPFPAPRLS
jgi:hypothetical protein